MKSDQHRKKTDSSSQRTPFFYASVTALTLGLLGGVYGVLRPATVPGLRTLYHSYNERILEPYHQEQTHETLAQLTDYFEQHEDYERLHSHFTDAEQTLDRLLSDQAIRTYTGGTAYDSFSPDEREILQDEIKKYLLLESLSSNYNPRYIDVIKGVGIIPLSYQDAEEAGFDTHPIVRTIQLDIGRLPFAQFIERFEEYQRDLDNGVGRISDYLDDDRLNADLIYSYHIEQLFPIAVSLYEEHDVTDIRFTALAREVGYEAVNQALRSSGSMIYEDYVDQFDSSAEHIIPKRFRMDAIDQLVDRYR